MTANATASVLMKWSRNTFSRACSATVRKSMIGRVRVLPRDDLLDGRAYRARCELAAHVEGHGAEKRRLLARHEELRRRILLDLAVLGVAHDADDLACRAAPPLPVVMRLPTASVPSPNLSTKRSLTIATFGRSAPPPRSKPEPAISGISTRSEEVGAHAVDRDVGVFAGSRVVALDADVVVPVVAGEQRHCGEPPALVTPGICASSSTRRSKNALAALARIAVAIRRDREHRQRIGAEPEVDARDVGQALREPPREHEQRHRQRDLRRRQRRAKARGALAARRPHALRLQRGVRLERARA